MLFIDTLMSVFWTEKGQNPPQLSATSSLQNLEESAFHTPNEPVAPLRSLARPSLLIPEAASTTPTNKTAAAPTTAALSPSPGRHLRQPQARKPRSGPVEQKAVVDPETFTASLVILPFTLKNMALKYVPDLKWNLEFGGVNWQFYVHVLSSERGRCDTALVGLKVTGDETLGSASSSNAPSGEEITAAGHLSSMDTVLTYTSMPGASAFQVGWTAVSNVNDAPVAVCPPSVHHIEPEDEYVVEFTDEEFNFINSLDDGLTLHVTIKLLPPTPTHSRSLSEAEGGGNASGEEEEEDQFYESEEDELFRRETAPLSAGVVTAEAS